jgi:oxalate decarboxylase/phosphoglucose isomerase-like protein (cupin superfamily)
MKEVVFFDIQSEIYQDARGLSFHPLKGRLRQPEKIAASLHLVSILPGQSRGNHLHPEQAEWLYPFEGAGVFVWQEVNGEVRERPISGHDTVIFIPPGIAHALRNPGPEVMFLLAWRESEGGTEENETLPHPLG